MSDALDKMIPVAKLRAVTTGDFPKDIVDGAMFKDELLVSIGVVELTPNEEMIALKRAKGVADALVFEMSKMCIAEVNGKPIDKTQGEEETVWAALGPKRRNLLIMLYGHTHQPTDSGAAGFLKGLKVKV